MCPGSQLGPRAQAQLGSLEPCWLRPCPATCPVPCPVCRLGVLPGGLTALQPELATACLGWTSRPALANAPWAALCPSRLPHMRAAWTLRSCLGPQHCVPPTGSSLPEAHWLLLPTEPWPLMGTWHCQHLLAPSLPWPLTYFLSLLGAPGRADCNSSAYLPRLPPHEVSIGLDIRILLCGGGNTCTSCTPAARSAALCPLPSILQEELLTSHHV